MRNATIEENPGWQIAPDSSDRHYTIWNAGDGAFMPSTKEGLDAADFSAVMDEPVRC